MIKFISLHPKKSIKDVIVDIGKQLKFTKSNFKEINAIFVQDLATSRYHLHLYSRDVNFPAQLNAIAKSSADENFKTIEICKSNVLYVTPPHNSSVYDVRLMANTDEFHEKVIKFNTGPNRSIIDMLLLIDVNKHPIHYIVCNRDNTYVCFKDGTDAVLVIDLLKSNQINANYSISTAYIKYNGQGTTHMNPQRADNSSGVNIRPQQVGHQAFPANLSNRTMHERQHISFAAQHVNNRTGTRGVRFPRNNWSNNNRSNNHLQDLRQNLSRVNTRNAHRGNFVNYRNNFFNQRVHRQQQNQFGRNVNINIPANVDPSSHNIIFVPKF